MATLFLYIATRKAKIRKKNPEFFLQGCVKNFLKMQVLQFACPGANFEDEKHGNLQTVTIDSRLDAVRGGRFMYVLEIAASDWVWIAFLLFFLLSLLLLLLLLLLRLLRYLASRRLTFLTNQSSFCFLG